MCVLYLVEKSIGSPTESCSVGAFTTSRFILAFLAMLTSEHEAVDISLVLSNGLMGLTQTIVRLSGMCVGVCSVLIRVC